METEILNMFVDAANSPSVTSECLSWWFVDRSLTPGFSGGNKLTCIYCTGAQAAIELTATKLVNDNYTLYGPDSDWWAEHEGMVDEISGVAYAPAENLLISVENGSVTGSDGPGNANVYFYHENDSTYWDLTGESDETCELVGDFFLGESENGEVNSLNVRFVDSQWTGRVLYGDTERSGEVTLSLDETSEWIVTASTKIDSLTLAEGAVIAAPEGYELTVTVDGVEVELTAGEYVGEILLTVTENGENTDDTYGINVTASADSDSNDDTSASGEVDASASGETDASASGEQTTTTTTTTTVEESHARSGLYTDEEYDEFEAYIASATAGMPSDVPGYSDMMTASLDDYESLEAAKEWVDSQNSMSAAGGSSGESGGVTGTGGNGSFVSGILNWSDTDSFDVDVMTGVLQSDIY